MKYLSLTVAGLLLLFAEGHWARAHAQEPAKSADTGAKEQDFILLLSPKALAHWRQCGPGRFLVTNGVAVGEGGMGLWWYAERQFTNFVLRGEFLQEHEIADSGVFLRFPDPGQDPWLAVNQGHEMEIGDPAPQDPTWRTGSIYPFAASSKANTKPVGQWNTYEIICQGQDYLVRINDEVVTRWTDPKARTFCGYIGLQNYNDNKIVRHRNLRIKELPLSKPRRRRGSATRAGHKELEARRRQPAPEPMRSPA